MNIKNIFKNHEIYKQKNLLNRYFPSRLVDNIIKENKLNAKIIGKSVLGKNIYAIEQGSGDIKVTLWSQMHGNETTATKAIFDLLNFLNSDNECAIKLKKGLKIHFIPQLNPDGADKYTRRNALNIDINRDFNAEQTPEIKVLKSYITQNKSEFLFNLHDQRSIFNIENTKKPATISLLSPSIDKHNSYSNNRETAAKIIYSIYNDLQMLTRVQASRFTDEFYPNATGDNFQKLGYNTILIESGHYNDDYNRVKVRELAYYTILSGLISILSKNYISNSKEDYISIPNNSKDAYDILFTNVNITINKNFFKISLGLQYEEILIDDKIVFKAKVTDIGDLSSKFGYLEIDATNLETTITDVPKIGDYANFIIGGYKFIDGELI